MFRAFVLFIALVATLTLAVPTPKRHHSFASTVTSTKRIGSFKAASRGRHSSHGSVGSQRLNRNPRAEMERVYRKYNWSITFVTPEGETLTLGLPGSDSGSDSGSNSGSLSSDQPAVPEYSSPATTSTATALDSSSADYTSAPVAVSSTPAAISSAPAAVSSAPAAVYSTPAATSSAATPSSYAPAAGDSENGEVSATPEENESEYLSPVTIGGQQLTLDFDTGSADLWVFSTSLSASEIGSHAAYDPSKSSTSEAYDGGSWKISYGDGSGASGTVVFDTVDVGGATATRQAVEVATYVSSAFANDENNDGLLGLAFSTINTVKPTSQKTFFENIMDDLDQPVFTADLEDNAAGTYEFGTVDSAKYEGDIHFTTVDTTNGFWEFESSTYSIGGKTYTNDGASSAIADTGTSLLLVDDAVAKAYYDQIQGSELSNSAGGYVYPCDADVPEFGVQIGNSGFIATIPGSAVSFAEVGVSTCFGGIQGNSGQGIQIFGDVLLKQYFAVFNGGNKTFGVAKKSAGSQAADS